MGPDTRITATAARPGALDRAKMVVLEAMPLQYSQIRAAVYALHARTLHAWKPHRRVTRRRGLAAPIHCGTFFLATPTYQPTSVSTRGQTSAQAKQKMDVFQDRGVRHSCRAWQKPRRRQSRGGGLTFKPVMVEPTSSLHRLRLKTGMTKFVGSDEAIRPDRCRRFCSQAATASGKSHRERLIYRNRTCRSGWLYP